MPLVYLALVNSICNTCFCPSGWVRNITSGGGPVRLISILNSKRFYFVLTEAVHLKAPVIAGNDLNVLFLLICGLTFFSVSKEISIMEVNF